MAKRKHSPKPNTAAITRVVEPNAAGIDIGATEIFVAVPPDRDAQPVRCFATFTCELEQICRVAQEVRRRERRHGVHRRILDSLIPDPGGPRISGLVGECPPRKKRSGQEDRCRGLPMAAVLACGRAASSLASAATGDLRYALNLATPREPRTTGICSHPAHAKGSRSDERPAPSRH